MKRKKTSDFIFFLSIGALFTIFVGFFFSDSLSAKYSQDVDGGISINSTEIFNNDAALFSYVLKYGPKQTIQQLNSLSSTFGSCHDSAHRAGHFSYEIYGDQAFKQCSSECHSGCYHGATESYFKEHGTANLSQNLKLLCSSELNPFFSHQCLHGIGHGLMAWADYDLPEALNSCNLLTDQMAQASCWTGVFMENIVGTLGAEVGHSTIYLSNNPHFPCDFVVEKYKGACYLLQTSHMVKLYNWDFSKVSEACLGAPKLYQRTCFESMGRDIGGSFRNNPIGAIEQCEFSPKGDLRTGCLMGAVQDTFWDPQGQDQAIGFCKLLTETQEKASCYNMIIGRATQVLTTTQEKTIFCQKVESSYQSLCSGYLKS